jgi:uncharacterized damage-inducible protein DinB
MEEQLIETWAIHNRINLYFLDAITDGNLSLSLPPRSRSVFDLFAHIHNVRLMWIKAAKPELLAGLEKLETKAAGTREQLKSVLADSGQAIEMLLRQSLVPGGKVKGFKPHPVAFAGYLISHESHHRGQAGWILKLSGHPLDQKTMYGMWEWGTR